MHVVGMGGDEAAPPIANPALEQFKLPSFRIEKILEGMNDKWSEMHQRALQSTVSA